jgi:hypothetical protein
MDTVRDVFKETSQKAYDLMAQIERDERGNPFTLEDTIRCIILKNPEMAPYRDDALGILYTLLGGGIRWHDGRLGDNSPNNYINMPPAAGGQGCWSHEFGFDESLLKILGNSQELLNGYKTEWTLKQEARKSRIIETVENIDERCQQYSPPKYKYWYPISWYGCNLCVPHDAQEDFRDGAIETLNLILNAECEMGTKDWMNQQRTKKYAEEILEALMVAKNEKKE